MKRNHRAVRRVVVLGVPRLQPLDAVGPLEVFGTATRLAREKDPSAAPPYSTELVGLHAGVLEAGSGGYGLAASRRYDQVRGSIDTLVVAGGIGVRRALRDDALLRWLRRVPNRARRVASVCTGALLLAEAGLLDGRRATTHWATCDALARRHPSINVERDPIYIKDGPFYTSAGVTAGIDLALELVEEDLGHEMALMVSKWLVMFLKRPGGQAQFSAHLEEQETESKPLADLRVWMSSHPSDDLSVDALARRVSMSPRNFARRFAREIGVTPAKYAEQVRVETARRRLEVTQWGVEEVATKTGFASSEIMRRTFLRNLGVTPADYRARFAH